MASKCHACCLHVLQVPLNCSAKALDWHFLPITSTSTCTFDMSGQNASSLLQQYGNHTYQAYFVYKCGQGKEVRAVFPCLLLLL